MKNLIVFIAAITLISGAATLIADDTVLCSSISNILDAAHKKGIKNIMKMEYNNGRWLIEESVDGEKTKKQHIFVCICDKKDGGKQSVPAPKLKMPANVEKIVLSIEKNNEGKIDKVEWQNNSRTWKISLNHDSTDIEYILDKNGKVLQKFLID